MPYEDIIKVAATLLTVLLPTVTAIFAFRSAERRIAKDHGKSSSQIISYLDPLNEIVSQLDTLNDVYKRQCDRDQDWQQAVLRELRDIAKALGR